MNDIHKHLAVFYRRGRRAFVELTSDEATSAGADTRALSAAGLIERGLVAGVHTVRLTPEGEAKFHETRKGAA